jgi:hypothetical protein
MNGFLAKLRLLPPPYILGSSASTFELLTRLVVASAVQPPDRDIENTRKGDPYRQRKEAPSRDFIQPMERDDRCNDNHHCGTILIMPSNGLWTAKNIHDHAAFSASWMKNSASAVPRVEVRGNLKMRQTENAIHTKSIVQTGAKIQFGGLKEGLARLAYQGSRLG